MSFELKFTQCKCKNVIFVFANAKIVYPMQKFVSKYQEIELLIAMGEYQEGADPVADRAIRNRPLVEQFLHQTPDENLPLEESLQQLFGAIKE